MGRMRVFISSTVDLPAERDAAEELLESLDIKGERFEAWPSSPNAPMDECFERIEESHAFICILGACYGTVLESGISATHAEYRHAVRTSKPVFVYLLSATDSAEPRQSDLIKEVRQGQFHGPRIADVPELKVSIRRSLLQEFQRCFVKEHSDEPPVQSPVKRRGPVPQSSPVELPKTAEETVALLQKLYATGQNAVVHARAHVCELHYRESLEVMNIVYAAEVNLGLNGYAADHNRLQRAIDFWKRVRPEGGENRVQLDYNVANALFALEEYAKAAAAYRAVLARKPDYAEAWKNLGGALLQTGDRKAGKEAFQKALNHQPQLFEAKYSLATIAITEDEDFTTALSYLDAIDLSSLTDDRIATVYGWKAIAFLRLDKLEEGIAAAEQAIASDPEAQWAWSTAGRLYFLIRRRDQSWLARASEFWERFLRRHPDVPEAWGELGFVSWFLWQRDSEEEAAQRAIAAFTRATELGYEDEGLVWDRIGHLCQRQGKWQEAVPAFQKAVEKSPDQFGYCLGVGLLQVQQYDAALPYLLAAAEENQPDAMSWCHVAECYDKLGRPDDAERAYCTALSVDSQWADAWFNLGGFYWNRNRTGDALDAWRTALRKFPHNDHCEQVRDILAQSALRL